MTKLFKGITPNHSGMFQPTDATPSASWHELRNRAGSLGFKTMSMPPMLRWALGRLPMSPEEAARLEREEFEAKGFVPNIERLLVAVDASPSGQFASRLVGLLAGARRIPTTVIHFDCEGTGSFRKSARQAERTKAVAKESAKEGGEADPAEQGGDHSS